MKTLFKYETDNFHMTIHDAAPRIFRLRAWGTANYEDVLRMLEAIKQTIPKNIKSHLVINVDGLKSFPWSLRKTIYEDATSWFRDGRLLHMYLVYPTPFVRMVGFLVGKFYTEIHHSYYDSEESAINQSKRALLQEGKSFGLKSVRKVLDLSASVENIQVDQLYENSHEKGGVSLLLLNKKLLLARLKGHVSIDQVQEVKDEIVKFLKNADVRILISDFSGIHDYSLSIEQGPGFFSAFEEFNIRQHVALPVLLRDIVFQITGIEFKMRAGISIIDSVEQAVYEELKDEGSDEYLRPNITVLEHLEKEDIQDLSKSELEGIIQSFQQDMISIIRDQQKKINVITSVLDKITWSNDFESKELDLPDEGDAFYHLYQAVNVLQKDIVQISEQIQLTSAQMEKTVEKRTRDIKKAESNLRSLLDNYTSPIFLLDRNYKLIDFNNAFNKLINIAYGVELNKGDDFFQPFDESLIPLWKERFELCLKGRKKDYTENYLIDGTEYYYEIRVFPIYIESEISGIGVFASNVTDLNISKRTLEDQNISLVKLNNELDSFIYRSSHDLRAPVSSLLGLINLAKVVDDEEEMNNCLDLMEKSVNKMENFIKDIIDHTKNSKLELEPSTINLDELLADLVSEFEHLDPTKTVKFESELLGECTFVTDRYRLMTVLTNIISNAIKYKSNRRKPAVHLSITVHQGSANIVISDNGQGIKEDYLPKIFDMFFRANEDSVGTGLGLYIVKDIVEKLGGTIDMESEFGVGTSVHIRIPELQVAGDEVEV